MSISKYLRKKPLEAYAADIKASQLHRTPGKWELTAIGVGAVIGGGIFVLTGVAYNVVGAIASFVAAVTPIEKATRMTSIGTLFAFAMICAAVLILRKKEPHINRPYKVKYLSLIAPLGILFNIFLMMSLDKTTWLRFVGWSVVGVGIYFMYSARHSKLNQDKNQ